MGISIPVTGAPGLLDAGSDPGAAYAQLVIGTYGASEYMRLTDIESGTAITAQVDSARNGTLTGWTLQNGDSPVAGESLKPPLSDGVNDIGDIQTASLTSLFDSAEGGVFGWARVSDASVWTDGVFRYPLYLYVDGNNLVFVRKASLSNSLTMRYEAGGTQKTVNVSMSPVDWFSFALTWSVSADEVKGYINGSQESFTLSGLGTWVGSLAESTLGAIAGPALVWDGWLAHFALWAGSVPSDADIAAIHAAAS